MERPLQTQTPKLKSGTAVSRATPQRQAGRWSDRQRNADVRADHSQGAECVREGEESMTKEERAKLIAKGDHNYVEEMIKAGEVYRKTRACPAWEKGV
jgi:hypothetical protein